MADDTEGLQILADLIYAMASKFGLRMNDEKRK